MTLRKFLTDPATKKPKRGALTRVAEYMEVSINTVKRWYSGEWKPGKETKSKLSDMISRNIDISPRCRGRSGRKNKLT